MLRSASRVKRSVAGVGAAALAMAFVLAGPAVRAQEAEKPAGPAQAPRSTVAAGVPVHLPDGQGGIGLDDLQFSTGLNRVLVPAGRTGRLDFVDPRTYAVSGVGGFSTGTANRGEGITSVDEGGGFLFVTDRTSLILSVIDPRSRRVVGRAKLAGGPDYVRFVVPTREVWVTEPEQEGIEVFTLPKGPRPKPVHAAFVKVPGGPESLVVDAARGRAYTNLWKDGTVALDLKARAIAAQWPNGCGGSRGLALDAEKGWLFVGCAEGGARVLDVGHDGRVLSEMAAGAGVDIIAYDPALRHLYVPGGKAATLTIMGVTEQGTLVLLGTVPTVPGARAVAAGHGTAFVADPAQGRLLAVADPHPAMKP